VIPSTTVGAVHVRWDPALEPPTLGGLLVLRQEAELLAQIRGCNDVWVHTSDRSDVARNIFASSRICFHLTADAPPPDVWPPAAGHDHISYFSFGRVLTLWRTRKIRPRLAWDDTAQQEASCLRRLYRGKLICVHLRNVPPFGLEESNADGSAWSAFFRAHARPGHTDFLLLGSDALPRGLVLCPGVTRAADGDVSLVSQLALIAQADGFVGMASGVCTAANFSNTPHVIFKHPAHHTGQMAVELGNGDQFPFATGKQKLWRRPATAEALTEAMEVVA
jgi:hypothetical protein